MYHNRLDNAQTDEERTEISEEFLKAVIQENSLTELFRYRSVQPA